MLTRLRDWLHKTLKLPHCLYCLNPIWRRGQKVCSSRCVTDFIQSHSGSAWEGVIAHHLSGLRNRLMVQIRAENPDLAKRWEGPTVNKPLEVLGLLEEYIDVLRSQAQPLRAHHQDRNKLAPVTVAELDYWLKRNMNLTWYLLGGNRTTFGPLKYLDFQVDTRFLHIWRLRARNLEISTHDEGQGTLLSVLEDRLRSR